MIPLLRIGAIRSDENVSPRIARIADRVIKELREATVFATRSRHEATEITSVVAVKLANSGRLVLLTEHVGRYKPETTTLVVGETTELPSGRGFEPEDTFQNPIPRGMYDVSKRPYLQATLLMSGKVTLVYDANDDRDLLESGFAALDYSHLAPMFIANWPSTGFLPDREAVRVDV